MNPWTKKKMKLNLTGNIFVLFIAVSNPVLIFSKEIRGKLKTKEVLRIPGTQRVFHYRLTPASSMQENQSRNRNISNKFYLVLTCYKGLKENYIFWTL